MPDFEYDVVVGFYKSFYTFSVFVGQVVDAVLGVIICVSYVLPEQPWVMSKHVLEIFPGLVNVNVYSFT
jgi:hypothetical protein